MMKQKLKVAMALMADRDNTARDVAAQLGVSVSTLYAYVDAKDSHERASELPTKRGTRDPRQRHSVKRCQPVFSRPTRHCDMVAS